MKKNKRALITGVSGQDGSYLSELLLEAGYEVWGLSRLTAHRSENLQNLKSCIGKKGFHLIYGDMSDGGSLEEAVRQSKPDEVYNLAAHAYVPASWDRPEIVTDVNYTGVVRLLEAVRRQSPKARVYQASTSEMFGNAKESPQNEKTKFMPESPYAMTKVAAHELAEMYRERYGLWVTCGILFSHKSERCGEQFLLRRLPKYVVELNRTLFNSSNGHTKPNPMVLSNLDSKCDWGYAPEYVEMIWKMLQAPSPGTWVVGTGETHTVQELISETFRQINQDWKPWIRVKENTEAVVRTNLCADTHKVKKEFGWVAKTRFKGLVEKMYEHALTLNRD